MQRDQVKETSNTLNRQIVQMGYLAAGDYIIVPVVVLTKRLDDAGSSDLESVPSDCSPQANCNIYRFDFSNLIPFFPLSFQI